MIIYTKKEAENKLKEEHETPAFRYFSLWLFLDMKV